MSLGPLTKNNSLLLYALLVQLLVFYAWEAHLGPFFIHLNTSVRARCYRISSSPLVFKCT